MVREFQSVIGREARRQILEQAGRLPDVVVACVGGGSNAIGIFDAFLDDRGVRLIGVEAGGERIAPGRHAARFAGGSTGVLQGTRTFVLQDEAGNIELTHSISAGLDYAAVGPEHAWLRDQRAHRVRVRHRRRGARRVPGAGALRGHHPGARVGARGRARHGDRRATLPARRGRAGQPLGPRRQGRAERGGGAAMSRLRRRVRPRRRPSGRPGLVTYVTAGDPTLARTAGILRALDRAGADVLEVGVPFSDPLADGPVIQRATERALAAGTTLAGVLDLVASVRADIRAGLVIFSYANPILRLGAERVRRSRARPPAWTACSSSTCRSKKPATSARCSARGALIQSSCSARRRPTSGCGRPRPSAAAFSMPSRASA